jgi:hypothetical protein
MQAIQAIQPATITQISIGHYVPVTPTEESQADKGIDHPIVSCWDCDTEWRSYDLTRCPHCAREVGAPRELNKDETWDLMEAVSYLDERKTFDYDTEYETWEFHLLLQKHTWWYDMNSRVLIQACYFALLERQASLERNPHPKIAFAIAFFRAEYDEALDDEMMYDPNKNEVPAHVVAWGEYLDRQKQYDLEKPSW